MRTRTTQTPVWVKAILVAFGLGIPAWWLADRHDRVTNQDRLAAIASAIAGRPVQVHCPGPFGRALGYDIVEGSVRFDAAGKPADDTKLRKASCAELDALAEGRRAAQLACVERSTSCGDDAQAVARAVDVLTHEAFHMRGERNEGVTECSSLQTMAWTAQRLGATPVQAQGLARLQLETGYPLMPSQYRAPGCADGERLDLRPDDPVWP